MSDKSSKTLTAPADIIDDNTPTFIISLLAFQPENQNQPVDVNELSAALARQEKLLAAYGLIVVAAKVSGVPSREAGQRFAEGHEVKTVSPLN